jgi:hypothetical protein
MINSINKDSGCHPQDFPAWVVGRIDHRQGSNVICKSLHIHVRCFNTLEIMVKS